MFQVIITPSSDIAFDHLSPILLRKLAQGPTDLLISPHHLATFSPSNMFKSESACWIHFHRPFSSVTQVKQIAACTNISSSPLWFFCPSHSLKTHSPAPRDRLSFNLSIPLPDFNTSINLPFTSSAPRRATPYYNTMNWNNVDML